MIYQLRNSVFTKVLWGLMALYLLNISVDTPDPNATFVAEDLSINDQESIIEMLVEQVFGYENAFKEVDDHDAEEHNKTKITKIDLMACVTQTDLCRKNQHQYSFRFASDQDHLLTSRYKEIEGPPPKI